MDRAASLGWRAGIETPWVFHATTTLALATIGASTFASFSLVGWMGPPALETHVPFHVALLGGWGVFAALWSVARATGRVGEGSDAGLRLAIVALAGRAVMDTLLLFVRLQGLDSAAEPAASLAAPLRLLTLFAFGYGLALAATASVVDVVRRGRHAAWMLVPYRLIEAAPLPGRADIATLPRKMRKRETARLRAIERAQRRPATPGPGATD